MCRSFAGRGYSLSLWWQLLAHLNSSSILHAVCWQAYKAGWASPVAGDDTGVLPGDFELWDMDEGVNYYFSLPSMHLVRRGYVSQTVTVCAHAPVVQGCGSFDCGQANGRGKGEPSRRCSATHTTQPHEADHQAPTRCVTHNPQGDKNLIRIRMSAAFSLTANAAPNNRLLQQAYFISLRCGGGRRSGAPGCWGVDQPQVRCGVVRGTGMLGSLSASGAMGAALASISDR